MRYVTQFYERIVIGGGAMGLAAAWKIAEAGASVLLLERFEPHHHNGASHGATRNLNNAYREDFYLDLYDEAFKLWQGLEEASGKRLLTLCGLVTHGDSQIVHDTYEFLNKRNAPVDLLSAEQAAARWPGMRFDGDVLFNPQAGRIHAETALDVLTSQAKGHGAKILHGQQVISLESNGGRIHVVARDTNGNTTRYEAAGAVVTAGAWTRSLLEGIIELPRLTVTEEHPAHFTIRDDFQEAQWPSFNHFTTEVPGKDGGVGAAYGMYTPGEGVKVGFHLVGDEVRPDDRPFRASDIMREELCGYVARWFPGVDPGSAVEISCTYTSTDSERFVLDTIGEITIGAGFSGHGFKFVPAIGRILADASLGVAKTPQEFRLDEHRRS